MLTKGDNKIKNFHGCTSYCGLPHAMYITVAVVKAFEGYRVFREHCMIIISMLFYDLHIKVDLE
jgi:hypothetical protein